jgi:hypothetical protein
LYTLRKTFLGKNPKFEDLKPKFFYTIQERNIQAYRFDQPGKAAQEWTLRVSLPFSIHLPFYFEKSPIQGF